MKWEPVVSVSLPYPVSANRYWTSRAVRNSEGKWIAITHPSTEAQRYREAVKWAVSRHVRQPITGRVRVDIQLYPHCPKDWKTRVGKDPLWWADTVQRIDLDNAMKVLLDSIKGIAIVDDDQVWKTTSEVMEPQPNVEACVVVRICRGIKDNPQAELELQSQGESHAERERAAWP